MMNSKPNWTREKLLRRIDVLLDQASVNGDGSEADRLGKIVQQIGRELAANQGVLAKQASADPAPVPLYEVAAFVDGTSLDTHRAREITQLAAHDPGLVMEMVAAISSRRQSKPSTIPDALRSRLLAMGPANAMGPVKTPASDNRLPQVVLSPDTASQRPHERRDMGWTVAAGLAIATAICLVIGWWIQPDSELPNENIAQSPSEIENHLAGEDSNPNLNGSGPSGPGLAKDDDGRNELDKDFETPLPDSPAMDPADRNVKLTLDPKRSQGGDDGDRETSPSLAKIRPETEPPAMDEDQIASIDGSPLDSRRLRLKWDQIDGVFVQSGLPPSPTESRTNSLSTGIPKASVREGAVSQWDFDQPSAPVSWQTLPLSRATAFIQSESDDDLGSKSQLVIASDTQLVITDRGAIDLRYGAFAFVSLPDGTEQRINAGDRELELTTDQQGSLLAEKTVRGLKLSAHGAMKVQGQDISNKSVLVADGTIISLPQDEHSEMPRWTRQRVDRISVDRNILAQLATSDDITGTLLQAHEAAGTSPRSLPIIRQWLISSQQDQLLPLLGSANPLIREAALMHLRMTPPNNPRHAVVWRGLQSGAGNKRTFGAVRLFFIELWSGKRPDGTRREQLLRLLGTPDLATRATANYLLRSFYGAGPRFDANATQANRQRTANAWRTRMNQVGP